MKIDPYKHKERYITWKNSLNGAISGVSEANYKTILDYVFDMEQGLNVASGNRKGGRSYIRLNDLRQRIVFICRQFQILYGLTDITKVSERNLHEFFNGMRNGTIKRMDGKTYTAVSDYVRIFKAFWHWYQKSSKKKGIEIPDLTTDLAAYKDKPDWVYLTEEQVKKLVDNANYDYKVLITFLYDTGIRAPTELMNVKVSDFLNDFKELHIREEVSKTFGRRIKLMLSANAIKEYIEINRLNSDDFLFTKTPPIINKYLKRLSTKLFGEGVSPAGQKYSELSMYDFRHCSCCYWLPRYKSESALKFRFGWKGSDKIHYYSEMLGMRDTISEEDMLTDITKTEIEKKLVTSENENVRLKERIDILENQMKEILNLIGKTKNIINSK